MGGRAAMGMFQYLEEIGIYPNKVGVVGGVSLGALSLMGVAKNMNAREMIDYSLDLTSEFQFTPNKKTKFGSSDPEVGLKFLRDTLFGGQNPNLNDSQIPIVFGATNYETGQPVFLHGNYPILDAFRQSVSNPAVFSPVRNSHGVVFDGGLSFSVGVEFLRDEYHPQKTILFDIQSASNHTFSRDLEEPLPRILKKAIQLSERSLQLPTIGKSLSDIQFPWITSSLVHILSTFEGFKRSGDIL